MPPREFYHGTSLEAALAIQRDGFNVDLSGSNAGAMLGDGLYITTTLEKALNYAKPNPNAGAIFRLQVDLGRCYTVTEKHDPLRRTWGDQGFDSAWSKAGLIGVREENCVKDPARRVKIEDVILGNTSLARNAGYGVTNGRLFHSNNALARTWDVASNTGWECCERWCAERTIGYPLIVMLFMVLGAVFRFDDSAKSSLVWLADNGGFSGCDHVEIDVKNLCLGTQFVLRGGLALTLFFGLMMLLVCCCRKKAHDSCFMIKLLVLIAIFVGSMWIGDGNIYRFAKIAIVGAGFVVVSQMLCLLEFSYSVDPTRYTSVRDTDRKFVAISVVLQLCSIGFIVVSYMLFGGSMRTPEQRVGSDCENGIIQITMTILITIMFTALPHFCHNRFHKRIHNSLFPSSVVALYSSYYCFSALGSQTDRCNHFYDDNTVTSGASILDVLVGLVFVLLGVWYGASSTALQVSDDIIVDAEQPLHRDDSDKHMEIGSAWPLVRYHFVMMFVSMYMTMILCSWEVDSPQSDALENFGINKWSMTVKLVSQWVGVALYICNLYSPKLLYLWKYIFTGRSLALQISDAH